MKRYNKHSLAFIFLISTLSMMITYFFKNNDFHLIINQLNHPYLDFFFKCITFLGDGVLFVIIIVADAIKNKKFPLTPTIAALLTLITTAACKQFFFNDAPRPIAFFGQESLHLVEGVKMAHWNSFPSGHSTTAFAIFILLFRISTTKLIKISCLILAILAAFSRVYLSQHFLIDIIVGAFLGTTIALYSPILSDYILQKFKK